MFLIGLLITIVIAVKPTSEEISLLNHYGIPVESVKQLPITNNDLDEELLHFAKAEFGVPDYLDRDELEALRYFGLDELAIENSRIPKEVVDEELHELVEAKEKQDEQYSGDYLLADEKDELTKFGYNWQEVEANHVPNAFVDEFLREQEQKAAAPAQKRPLTDDEKVVAQHFNYDVQKLDESNLSRKVIDKELAGEVAREREEANLAPDQLRILNEMKRVRHVESKLGNVKHAHLY